MDWKIIFSTFLTVFFAELGDKTQLATFGISGNNENKMSVFVGSVLALTLSSFLAVILGSKIGNFFSKKIISIISGLLFIVMGLYMIFTGNSD